MISFNCDKTFRFLIWLPIVGLVIGCAPTMQVELKKPEKIKAVMCKDTQKRGKCFDPVDLTNQFIKGEGKKALIFIDFFDLVPSGRYLMRAEWSRPDGEICCSSGKHITPTSSHWKKWFWLNLDPKYNRQSGLWTVRVYVNDHFIIQRKFLVADDERELAKLEADYEKEMPKAAIEVKKQDETGQTEFKEDVISPKPIVQNWAVIIGISKYKNAGQNGLTNLIFADDDAKAFAMVLRNLGWSESHIKLLVDEEATRRNIMIALESWLTKAGPDDQIVLFWAGHGFPDPEDPEKVYFACYDTDILIPATGYRMDRVRAALEERKAKNVILFADTCHAGKLITRGDRGLSVVPRIDKLRRESKIPKGWIFMVGADTDRKAIEYTSWNHGAFTHCLIKGFSGEADGYESVAPKDGIITMGEIRAFLSTAMPAETQKVLGVAKRAIITTSTGDPDIWNTTLQTK